MSKPKILAVVGARPNMVKMAPVLAALGASGECELRLLHTGQHYDKALSGGLIERLGMPEPDANLEIGSGSHAEQTAAVLVGVEAELGEHRPEMLLVSGDVNSTMAAALSAAKERVPVAHLESGLRSGDWEMPEEVNRVVCDRVSDLLLCTSADAVENLATEGISGDHVELVGNTMIDSLMTIMSEVDVAEACARAEVERGGFVLVTLHRPSLVDDPEALSQTMAALGELAAESPVIFPAHPRTAARLEDASLDTAGEAVRISGPLDYQDFIALEAGARMVITDSGGVQEETSALGTPCLTYRTTTERPVTIELGTNRLVGVDPGDLLDASRETLEAPPPERAPEIPLWDGEAGRRAADAVLARLGEAS